MIKRVIAKIRRKERMLKDLCNEWRIMWKLKKMDKTMIGDYLGIQIVDIRNRIDMKVRIMLDLRSYGGTIAHSKREEDDT